MPRDPKRHQCLKSVTGVGGEEPYWGWSLSVLSRLGDTLTRGFAGRDEDITTNLCGAGVGPASGHSPCRRVACRADASLGWACARSRSAVGWTGVVRKILSPQLWARTAFTGIANRHATFLVSFTGRRVAARHSIVVEPSPLGKLLSSQHREANNKPQNHGHFGYLLIIAMYWCSQKRSALQLTCRAKYISSPRGQKRL